MCGNDAAGSAWAVHHRCQPTRTEMVGSKLSLSRSKRFNILRKCNFSCYYCGRRAPAITLEVDHVIPISRGGTDEETNLIAACWDCNRGKSAKNPFSEMPPESLEEWKVRQVEEHEFSFPHAQEWPDEFPNWMFSRRIFMRPVTIDFDIYEAASSACSAASVYSMNAAEVIGLAEGF